jgi:ubiquitin-protein ligase
VGAYLENAKHRNEQIRTLVDICSNFLGSKEWKASAEVAETILGSALLPLLEQAFRNGSWLDMAKAAEVYHSYLALARALAGQPQLMKCLGTLDKRYKPAQRDAVHKLLKKLYELAEIFLGCLDRQEGVKNSEGGDRPEKLARDVKATYTAVEAVMAESFAREEGERFIENALALPIAAQYRALLEPLRFDYMSMRDPKLTTSSGGTSDYVHHYKSSAASNESPPSSKMLRLAQELADLSNALPCEHTNSIYVRVDRERVDMMKALVVGSTGTPYAHGCFEFDLFCDNKYPNDSPKMNLMTTGAGSVRFNPNLYACGKVCLSLLGTWRGSATENWDPKLSTILQVLVSVQAIIMSEEVYFNEPGFENEAGTVEGEKKNEGYSNIVRYANVKFAMLG